MQPGDLVVVVKQPPNQMVKIQGEVGIIEELQPGEFAYFRALTPTGTSSGCGSVPLDCLEPEVRPAWVQAKDMHDARMMALDREAKERTARWQAFLDGLAAKHGISKEKILEIQADLNQWY